MRCSKRCRRPGLHSNWVRCFANQTLAQIELWTNKDSGKYESGHVYVLPKELDEKVARLHLKKFGANLTVLEKEQADYIGVPVEGPYKPEHYRY